MRFARPEVVEGVAALSVTASPRAATVPRVPVGARRGATPTSVIVSFSRRVPRARPAPFMSERRKRPRQSGEPTYRFRLHSPRCPFGFSSVARFFNVPLPSSPLLEAFNSAAFIRAEALDELGHRRLSAFQSVLDVSIAWGAFDGDPDPFRSMSATHDSCFMTGTPFVLVHSEPHIPTRHGSCRFHVDEHASASGQSIPELIGLSDLTPAYL